MLRYQSYFGTVWHFSFNEGLLEVLETAEQTISLQSVLIWPSAKQLWTTSRHFSIRVVVDPSSNRAYDKYMNKKLFMLKIELQVDQVAKEHG